MIDELETLRAIVRDLAAACPCRPSLAEGEDYQCWMCETDHGDMESHELARHKPSCPWRRARELESKKTDGLGFAY